MRSFITFGCRVVSAMGWPSEGGYSISCSSGRAPILACLSPTGCGITPRKPGACATPYPSMITRRSRGAAGAPAARGEISLPTALLALVLLIEPGLQGGEVVEDGGGVHLVLAGDFLEGFGPGAALPHLQHLRQALARDLVVVDRAAVERTLVASCLAEAALELELEDVGQEIAHV